MEHPHHEYETERDLSRDETVIRGLGRTLRQTKDKILDTIRWRLKPKTDSHDRRMMKAAAGEAKQEEVEQRHYPYGLTIGPTLDPQQRPAELSEQAQQREYDLERARHRALALALAQMNRQYGLKDADLLIDRNSIIWISEEALKAFRKRRETRKRLKNQRRIKVRKSVSYELMREMEMPLLQRVRRRDKKESSTLGLFEEELQQRFHTLFDPVFQDLSARFAGELGIDRIASDQFGSRVCPLQVIHDRLIQDEDIIAGKRWESSRSVLIARDKLSGHYGILKLIELERQEVSGSKYALETQTDMKIPTHSTDAWLQKIKEAAPIRPARIGPDQTTREASRPPKGRLPLTNRQRFDREARALRQLQGQGAPLLLHSGRVTEWGYLFMEMLQGGRSLDRLFQEAGRFSVFSENGRLGVVDVIAGVAEILVQLHAEGVIHQDIKPANILYLPEEQQVFLVDYGGGMTKSFAPPEAYANFEEQDERSDLFALAATAYFLLTGMDPFGGVTANDTSVRKMSDRHEVIPLSRHQLQIPSQLCQLIESMLRKDPRQRPPSAQEVLDQIEAIHWQISASGHKKTAIG